MSRAGWLVVGLAVGVVLGASVRPATADTSREIEHATRALERIANSLEKCPR